MTGMLLPGDEAHRKAELLWSREELLAALVVREGVLKVYPQLEARLMEVAQRSYAAPRSPRPEREDGVLKRKVASETSAALERLLAAERERLPVNEAAHEALRQQALAWLDPATHPGYHWCVASEPRG